MDLQRLAEDGVKRALTAGADAAEAYALRTRSTGVVASGPYVTPSANDVQGIGVRLSVGGRVGVAGVLSHHEVDDAIARALASARRSGAAASFPFPAARAARHAVLRGSDPLADERQLDLLQSLMDGAQAQRHVTFFQFILRRWEREMAVANSSGLSVADASASGYLEAELRATRGTTDRTARTALAVAGNSFAAIEAHELVGTLVEQATSALDPSPLPRPMERVLLHPSPTAQLLALLGNAFSGSMLAAGRNALDAARPFAPCVDILDDPGGRRVFDDEGTPTHARHLVKGGAVVGHLHDARSALAMGVEPTGNGFRGGVKSPVAPKPNRLALAPGSHGMDALLEELDEGVLITEPLLGSFASDKVTADVSVIAPFAFYVRQGKVQHALPPTSVGGNAHEVFRNVHAIGQDARECASARVPAIVAGGVTCAT